MACQTNWQTF